MERKPWSVHFDMETNNESIQNTTNSAQKETKKKRSQADKVGKLKYLLAKDKKLDQDLAK